MPYYIYRVETLPGAVVRRVAKVAQFASFKEASAQAKTLRAAGDPVAGSVVKVIFADDELHAEALLTQVREPEPMIGDDY